MALPPDITDSLESRLCADFFKALCDPTRLSLVTRLAVAPAPLRVSEVSDCCGVHLSGVSRHLSILKQAGVVTAKKRGREVLYSLDCKALASTLRDLADALETCHSASCTMEMETDS